MWARGTGIILWLKDYVQHAKKHIWHNSAQGSDRPRIHSKPGKRSSARLETKRAPHMAEAQWTVWTLGDAQAVGVLYCVSFCVWPRR